MQERKRDTRVFQIFRTGADRSAERAVSGTEDVMEQGVIRMEQAVREENNRKKEYLRKYLEAKRMQEVLEREIDELRLDRMIPGSPAQDGMPHGSGGGDLSGYAARLDELDRSLHAQLERKLRIRKEITDKIDAISDETEGLILRMKYIHGLSFGKIAEKTGYSRRHTIRLHGQALENFKL